MIEIPLTRGQVAVIDDSDFCLVKDKKWHAVQRRDGKGWYAKSTGGTRMHRLLLGVWDERIVDHIDGNGLNNTRANLRVGTQSQNCVNRKNTPGKFLRGTIKHKNRWKAYIKYRGKQKSLGYFATEEEAHQAYLNAAINLHGNWLPLPAAPKEK